MMFTYSPRFRRVAEFGQSKTATAVVNYPSASYQVGPSCGDARGSAFYRALGGGQVDDGGGGSFWVFFFFFFLIFFGFSWGVTFSMR